MGKTEVVAEMIREKVGGTMFRIETVHEYPMDYAETTDVAKAEQKAGARPELRSHMSNMDDYGVIFLGYPNWWGTMPMAVFTFLEEYDLSGKTIAPFCTHEGGGLGSSGRDLRAACPDSKVLDGLDIYGSRVGSSAKTVNDWINGLKLI